MKKSLTFFWLLHATFECQHASAYDMPTHYDMSVEAAMRSVLQTDPHVLSSMGLQLPVDSKSQQFFATPGGNSDDFKEGCLHSVKFSILKLIGCGAQFEDAPGTRSLNHFYDPTDNGPLTVRFPPVIGQLQTLGMTSPDWVLKDNNDNSTQEFSYKDARNYFYKALTTKGPQQDRDVYWGKLFQSIGQVIHHVQDMAQPQHVRNDQHVDKLIPGYFNPSLYESYTSNPKNQRGVQALFSLPEANPVFTADNPGVFKSPRDFWKNAQGTGLAEFTNRNFVSAGTNFNLKNGQPVVGIGYRFPVPSGSETVNVQDLSPSVSQDVLDYCGNNCTMTFIPTNGDVYNQRAATASIFDQYVKLHPVKYQNPGSLNEYEVDEIPTINQYNIATTHPLLIPRAVGYSAGLINYFFRGKMEISLPDEGVYSVIDHAIENQKDTSGFRKIKLKLKNVTPRGAGIEPMATTGKLVAIAKFHRNNCYQPDLSGEYGSPGIDWRGCRTKDEEILLSGEVAVPDGINSDAQLLTFSFDTPIPINATDLFLQVVYKGALGDEPDAVVVATKDISEPSFQAGYYSTDEQKSYSISMISPTPRSFKEYHCDSADPPIPYDECKYRHRTSSYVRFAPPANFDPYNAPASFDALVSFEDVPVSQYSRIAYLADPGPKQVYRLEIPAWPYILSSYQYETGSGNVAVNQLAPNSNDLTSEQYKQARGVFGYYGVYNLLTSGDWPNPPAMTPLTPKPVTNIKF